MSFYQRKMLKQNERKGKEMKDPFKMTTEKSTIKLEVGENLADVLKEIIKETNDPTQIETIMKSFENMINNRKTYTCPNCGCPHYIGDKCYYKNET